MLPAAVDSSMLIPHTGSVVIAIGSLLLMLLVFDRCSAEASPAVDRERERQDATGRGNYGHLAVTNHDIELVTTICEGEAKARELVEGSTGSKLCAAIRVSRPL